MDPFALRVLRVGSLWLDQEGVGTEIISLGLDEVCWSVCSSVSVEEVQGGTETWGWDAQVNGSLDDASPAWLGLVNSIIEELVEQQVLEVRVGTIGLGDVLEEDRSNDATSSPHQCDFWLVEFPLVCLCSVLNEHKSLRIGNNLRCIESLFEIIDELFLVAFEFRSWASDLLGSLNTFSLESTETATENSFADQCNGHSEVQSIDGGPFTSTLLSSLIENLFQNSL
jgi:hypothetical protein